MFRKFILKIILHPIIIYFFLREKKIFFLSHGFIEIEPEVYFFKMNFFHPILELYIFDSFADKCLHPNADANRRTIRHIYLQHRP